MEVPRNFPKEAWSPSGEMRGYDDMGPAFAASGFSEQEPPDALDIRHMRRGYFAATSFTDAQLGRVMGALDSAGPGVADQTITLLWSDHGWHLGEKQHWQKFTAWRACTRVPLMVRVPKGTPGLPSGTKAAVSTRPVNLLSLGPTLLELCGLPAEAVHDGPSLVPLLKDPKSVWPHVSITHLDTPGSFGLSAERWRYIHYANGDEELYDIESDPYEWSNLAGQPKHANVLAELRELAPKAFAKKPPPSDASLPRLRFHPLSSGAKAPASHPDGKTFDVVFVNHRKVPVELFWMTRDGKRKSYGRIAAGKQKRQSTRPGAVWMVTGAGDRAIGYFSVGDRSARAVVRPRR